MTLLEIIRKNKFATATVATPATDNPVLVPSVAVAKQGSGKVVSPEDIKLEERRGKVLKMLEDQPSIQRAFLTDTEADPDNVILTMAIRDQCSFEMLIPKNKYDPFMLIEVIEKVNVQ